MIEAAKQAHAHKFIEQKLDNGYDTLVGQGGGRLSGGQRQRIALARAILRDPAILILDEATSQIDLESEQLIHKVLEQFIRHRTTVIVTHRLATLALADRVVVMKAAGSPTSARTSSCWRAAISTAGCTRFSSARRPRQRRFRRILAVRIGVRLARPLHYLLVGTGDARHCKQCRKPGPEQRRAQFRGRLQKRQWQQNDGNL